MTSGMRFKTMLAWTGLGLALAPSMAAARDAGQSGLTASQAAASRPIGVATQEADGTIVLQLRAEGPNGAIGDGLLRYAPDDKDYAMVARHVGPIPKGGSVPVKPFDR